MRKRHDKQRQRRGIPLSTIIAGAALLVLAAFLVVRQGGDPATGGTPHVAVDQQSVDYGYVKLGETRTINISVTNTGDGVLRFKEKPYVEVLKGCCPPELTVGSTTLNPGESTTVRSGPFMMHEGMDGPHEFGVHLKTNDPAQADYVVSLISNWGP
jgi:hypothetical protein